MPLAVAGQHQSICRLENTGEVTPVRITGGSFRVFDLFGREVAPAAVTPREAITYIAGAETVEF